MFSENLRHLERLNAGLAESLAARLAATPAPAADGLVRLVASETRWALSVEASFGRNVAEGYAELIGAVDSEKLEAYRRSVREAGRAGAAQGGIMARCLPPVLVHGGADLLRRFRAAWNALAGKGAYALHAPLEALGRLLKSGDAEGAAAYLDLLGAAFDQDLTYAEARDFIGALPKAALGLAPPRRRWQLAALVRVLQADRRLAEAFLAGLDRGLGLLEEQALAAFVDAALRKHGRDAGFAARFLALESRSSQAVFAGLQVRVGFGQVKDRLQRYLQARTGRALVVRPLTALPALYAGAVGPDRMVCSDGEAVYVPAEIGRFDRQAANAALYGALLRLEASFHEFGTIDFDLEKAIDNHPAVGALFEPPPGSPPASDAAPHGSDLERFFRRFPAPELAADLFTVFELGRVRLCLQRDYPGLVRRVYPWLRAEAMETLQPGRAATFCDALLLRVALAVAGREGTHPDRGVAAALGAAAAAFEAEIRPESPVEASAEMTARFFDAAFASDPSGRGGGLAPPFGWRPWPNPAADGTAAFGALAGRLKARFEAAGHFAYVSDIRRRLAANGGTLAPSDLCRLFGNGGRGAARPEELRRLAEPDAAPADPPSENGPFLSYPEWDVRLGDYLQDHVHLREKAVAPDGGDFYGEVLRRHQDLVRRTRAAFERLRPEGLRRLRRWRDGDEFDYRELIEACVDRRSGAVPSDRLFLKRVKDRRDVAVLLLADLSRSTANRVPGTDASVLDIEKQAIVVLCEALAVLGDGFAAAGFSGSGRRGVEYVRIKDFGEPLSSAVRGRIGTLRPRRNTRMGAAIRHAGRQLAAAPARVRLLIVLSDGFPNDSGYKGAYAAADTRQALIELGSRRIRFHALTVNLPADPQLDELYGRARHHVISDVRELPERLLRVYGSLTR